MNASKKQITYNRLKSSTNRRLSTLALAHSLHGEALAHLAASQTLTHECRVAPLQPRLEEGLLRVLQRLRLREEGILLHVQHVLLSRPQTALHVQHTHIPQTADLLGKHAHHLVVRAQQRHRALAHGRRLRELQLDV